jgi:hypothetical protein
MPKLFQHTADLLEQMAEAKPEDLGLYPITVENLETAVGVFELFSQLLKHELHRKGAPYNVSNLTIHDSVYSVDIGNRHVECKFEPELNQAIISCSPPAPVPEMMKLLKNGHDDIKDMPKKGTARGRIFDTQAPAVRLHEYLEVLCKHYGKPLNSTEIVQKNNKFQVSLSHDAHHKITQLEPLQAPDIQFGAGAMFMDVLSALENQKTQGFLNPTLPCNSSNHIVLMNMLFTGLRAVLGTHKYNQELIKDDLSVVYDHSPYKAHAKRDDAKQNTLIETSGNLPYAQIRAWYEEIVKELSQLKPQENRRFRIPSEDKNKATQMKLLSFSCGFHAGLDMTEHMHWVNQGAHEYFEIDPDAFKTLLQSMRPQKALVRTP